VAKSYLEAADQVQGDYERLYNSNTANDVVFYRNAVLNGLIAAVGVVGGLVLWITTTVCDYSGTKNAQYEFTGAEPGSMTEEGVNAACSVWNKFTGANTPGNKGRYVGGKVLKGLVW
jgi:hypothetical protein